MIISAVLIFKTQMSLQPRKLSRTGKNTRKSLLIQTKCHYLCCITAFLSISHPCLGQLISFGGTWGHLQYMTSQSVNKMACLIAFSLESNGRMTVNQFLISFWFHLHKNTAMSNSWNDSQTSARCKAEASENRWLSKTVGLFRLLFLIRLLKSAQ